MSDGDLIASIIGVIASPFIVIAYGWMMYRDKWHETRAFIRSEFPNKNDAELSNLFPRYF